MNLRDVWRVPAGIILSGWALLVAVKRVARGPLHFSADHVAQMVIEGRGAYGEHRAESGR